MDEQIPHGRSERGRPREAVMDLPPIEERARAAAWYACGDLGVYLDYQDFQDVIQSAAEGFWRGWRRKPDRMGYAVVSARNAAIKFIIRQLWGKNPFNVVGEEVLSYTPIVVKESRDGLPDEVLRELYHIFLGSRKKKGQRGALAAAREVFVCNALARGWETIGIAHALQTSRSQVKKCRRHIRAVLAKELERRSR